LIADCGLRIADWEARVDQDVLKKRTKQFALRVIHLTESLPAGKTADVIGRQLLRSGTSVAANYRAACRAKSPADFIAKMGIVEEETDESIYWMELLVEAGIVKESLLQPLMQEANELLAITVASINTAKKRKAKE
jgi:four helix bundle protein